jgi:prefoldin subunit 5
MFNSMQETHAAIRTMTNEELDQLATAASEMYANGMIDLDKMTVIMGIVIGHYIERSVNAQLAKV